MEPTQNPDWAWEQPDKVIQDLEEIKEELRKWQALGSRAKVWQYGMSLSQLQIRIEKINHPHNFIVICRGTLSICGQLQWDDANLDISHRSITRPFEGKPITTSWLVLRDAQAGFEVVCDQILAARDVEPLFWRD